LLDYVVNKRVWSRQGNRYPLGAPHSVYRCLGEDRWCAITIFSDDEWEKMCQVMGRPDLAKDSRFATLSQRKKNEDELDCIVSEWTSKMTAEKVMALLQEVGIAAGVAQTGRDLLENDAQLAHRQFFQELEHSEIGKHHYEAPPFRLSKTPCDLTMAGPCLGEHNEHVCTKLLGFSDEEYVNLTKDGVLV
ncbi:CoA transferase, partial [Chloroflexota bacterium]